MKNLTEDQLMENYDKLISIVKKHFTGDRRKNLLRLMEHFEYRMALAPAANKAHFHSAYPGGYVVHVLNVYNVALEMRELWRKFGASFNYTVDELVMVALFHDLGKIGDLNEEYYLPQDNQWRRDNMNELYKFNENLFNMPVPDRSLFLLQHFNVQLTRNEWVGIKIHDGLYDEGNKLYYIAWTDERQLKTNLPYVIHFADMTATRIEYEEWKKENKIEKIKNKSKPESKKLDDIKNDDDDKSNPFEKTQIDIDNLFDGFENNDDSSDNETFDDDKSS